MTLRETSLRLRAAAWHLVFCVADEISLQAARLSDHAAMRQYRCSDRAAFIREQRERRTP
jgi:hypothetical protein